MLHYITTQALEQARIAELHRRPGTDPLDQPLRVGLGQWQKTPAQLSSDEIETLVKRYADKLDKLHAAQIRLYRALLATDDIEAEFAALAVHQAVATLPDMPDWPDTDAELIARLKGRFAPAAPLEPAPGKPPDTTQPAEPAAHDLAA